MAPGRYRGYTSEGNRQGWKISWKAFQENYDPSVLPKETYLIYEIKWHYRRRPWQRWFCSNSTEHVEMCFVNDVCEKLKYNPAPCTITCYMSWSPCGACCQYIMGFLKEMPNVNLVIYVARLYWHKKEDNRKGLRTLKNMGVIIQVMDLPDYRYCWRTFIKNKNFSEENYWPRHFTPWIMLYSLELQSILQNIPSCLKIRFDRYQIPIFSLRIKDEHQKTSLTSANPVLNRRLRNP